jgi:hypothetical protein
VLEVGLELVFALVKGQELVWRMLEFRTPTVEIELGNSLGFLCQ